MLIVSFEEIERDTKLPEVLFRGRDGYFWKRRIFNDVPHYAGNKNGGDFHFLILFNPQRFLSASQACIDEIIDFLSQTDPQKDYIFSIEGNPFFAISREAFRKLGINLKEDNDIISQLEEKATVRPISLKETFRVLDLHKETKAIEDSVVDFQAAIFRRSGVMVEDLGHFFVEGTVPIGKGTRISSGVVIKGDSKIGENVHIYPHSYIENSTIGDQCTLLPGCVVRDSLLEEGVRIGPYTHLRDGALVKKGAKMGNFVEMKKSVLGEGSKSMHLTYIGDAEVGQGVNIGAGTITCNYDGVRKNKTVIEDGVFIGSGTELIAPIIVRKNSYVGAGSTINQEVPADSLAVAREKQRNIPGWVKRNKEKKSAGENKNT